MVQHVEVFGAVRCHHRLEDRDNQGGGLRGPSNLVMKTFHRLSWMQAHYLFDTPMSSLSRLCSIPSFSPTLATHRMFITWQLDSSDFCLQLTGCGTVCLGILFSRVFAAWNFRDRCVSCWVFIEYQQVLSWGFCLQVVLQLFFHVIRSNNCLDAEYCVSAR